MEDPDHKGTKAEAGQTGEEGRGCYYAINTLMILGLGIPILILLIFFILWLIPD
ncbi:MAG: hypothetical protein ACE15E_19960 [Acidobacteriota bacterium]